MYITSLVGNYDDVIETLIPVTDIIEANYLKRPLIMAYIKTGDITNLDKYLSEFALTATKEDMAYLYTFTGIQLINWETIPMYFFLKLHT